MELGKDKPSEEPENTVGSQESIFRRGRGMTHEDGQSRTSVDQAPDQKRRKRWQESSQVKRKEPEEDKIQEQESKPGQATTIGSSPHKVDIKIRGLVPLQKQNNNQKTKKQIKTNIINKIKNKLSSQQISNEEQPINSPKNFLEAFPSNSNSDHKTPIESAGPVIVQSSASFSGLEEEKTIQPACHQEKEIIPPPHPPRTKIDGKDDDNMCIKNVENINKVPIENNEIYQGQKTTRTEDKLRKQKTEEIKNRIKDIKDKHQKIRIWKRMEEEETKKKKRSEQQKQHSIKEFFKLKIEPKQTQQGSEFNNTTSSSSRGVTMEQFNGDNENKERPNIIKISNTSENNIKIKKIQTTLPQIFNKPIKTKINNPALTGQGVNINHKDKTINNQNWRENINPLSSDKTVQESKSNTVFNNKSKQIHFLKRSTIEPANKLSRFRGISSTERTKDLEEK